MQIDVEDILTHFRCFPATSALYFCDLYLASRFFTFAVMSSEEEERSDHSPESESSSDEGEDAEESSPTSKKIRFLDPDVTVIVGSEGNAKTYKAYGAILAFNSEYFDTMLSSGLKESSEMKIEFPEDDPKEWELLYPFLDPETARDQAIGADDARKLAPWFHKLMMTNRLKECDDVLKKELPPNSDRRWWGSRKGKYRKEKLDKILPLYCLSCKYGLEKTKECCNDNLCNAIESGYDLFDVPILKEILPLLEKENGQYKPRRLWKALNSFLVPDLSLMGPSPGITKDDPHLPNLIQLGMENRLLKKEIKYVWNVLPEKVYDALPDKKSLRNDCCNINHKARGEIKETVRNRWRNVDVVQLPEDY